MPSLQDVKTVAQRLALLVLLADMYHCYSYVTEYYAEDPTETEADRLAAEEAAVAGYTTNCSPDTVVTKAEFEQRVKERMDFLESVGDDKEVLEYRINHPAIKINRESVIFAGGGRAGLMQLTHPFVAAGIRDHSYLQSGVRRRFFNTFRYMFGLGFGTLEEIVQAAKGVNKLHSKVHGELQEDVGAFSAKSKFDANQKDALRFVQWTLVDTAVFEYELLVGKLTDEEKDTAARDSAKFLLLFGVPEQPGEDKITWKQFRRRLDAAARSNVTTVSDTALDTIEYLLLPPAPMYGPLMSMLKWSSCVSMPPKMGYEIGGRMYNTFADRVAFGVMQGLIRFQYRLLPTSFRFLNAYWNMYERAYGPRNAVSRFLSYLSSQVAEFMVAMLMPDRNPEKTVVAVKEIRAKRGPFVPAAVPRREGEADDEVLVKV